MSKSMRVYSWARVTHGIIYSKKKAYLLKLQQSDTCTKSNMSNASVNHAERTNKEKFYINKLKATRSTGIHILYAYIICARVCVHI
jgi:hypothetical protein